MVSGPPTSHDERRQLNVSHGANRDARDRHATWEESVTCWKALPSQRSFRRDANPTPTALSFTVLSGTVG